MRHNKIGFGSFALRWHVAEGLGPFHLLELAKEFGADVVQLCEDMKLRELSNADLSALRRTADDLGIALEVGVSGGRREVLARGVFEASVLGTGILRAVVDSDGTGIEDVKRNIRDLLPDLRASNTVLCIENHFRFSPAVIREIIEASADPHVAACLDPLNSIALLIGPEEAYRVLAPLAVTAHIKDAVINRAGTGFRLEGRIIGTGSLNLTEYIRSLSNQVGSFLVEGWMDKKESSEATMEEEKLWLRKGLEFIRTCVGMPGS